MKTTIVFFRDLCELRRYTRGPIMSATMPMKSLPRRNPLLTMARYMSDAGADGYTGLTLLYHQTTTQLIIQWTGVDISQSERIEAEQNLLKLLKGCEVIDTNEDIEPLDFDDPEPEMNDDTAVSEMESINFTEPASPEFEVKKEPEESTQNQCNKSVSSGDGDGEGSVNSFTSHAVEFSMSPFITASSVIGSTAHTTPHTTTNPTSQSTLFTSSFPGKEKHSLGQVTAGIQMPTLAYPSTAQSECTSTLSTQVTCKDSQKLPSEVKPSFLHSFQLFRGKKTNLTQHDVPFSSSSVNTPITASRSMSSAGKPVKVNDKFCFQCCRCDFISYTKAELDRHKHWAHSSNKPYQCTLCVFSCSYSHVLKRHLLTHTGEKPHQCKLCHKRFARSDSVVKHMETHSPRRSRPIESSRGHKDDRKSPHNIFLPAGSGIYSANISQKFSTPASLAHQSGFYLAAGFGRPSETNPPQTDKVENKQPCPSPPPLKDNRPVFPQRRDSFELDIPPEENDSNQQP